MKLDTIPIFLNYLASMITFKDGVLRNTGILATPLTFSIYTLGDELMAGAEFKKVALLLIIQVCMGIIFLIMSTVDLITGIQATLHENAMKDKPEKVGIVIKSKKLWSTFWKCFGILMLTLMLTVLSVIAELMDADVVLWFTTWSLIGFWFMATLFEFYSIGENLARKNNGKKPGIFNFFDRVLDALQQKAIDKINDKL